MSTATVDAKTQGSLSKNLDWYIANQEDLAAKHNGKVLLIVDQCLIEAFDDAGKAYAGGQSKYAAGTFTLQPCSPGPESYTLMIHNPAYGAVVPA